MSVTIEKLANITPEVVTAFSSLTCQLSEHAFPPSTEQLEEMIAAKNCHVFLARNSKMENF